MKPQHLQAIKVDPELIPEIRKVYLAAMSKYTNNRQREAQTLQNAIKKLEEKELNLWRAFTRTRNASTDFRAVITRI